MLIRNLTKMIRHKLRLYPKQLVRRVRRSSAALSHHPIPWHCAILNKRISSKWLYLTFRTVFLVVVSSYVHLMYEAGPKTAYESAPDLGIRSEDT